MRLEDSLEELDAKTYLEEVMGMTEEVEVVEVVERGKRPKKHRRMRRASQSSCIPPPNKTSCCVKVFFFLVLAVFLLCGLLIVSNYPQGALGQQLHHWLTTEDQPLLPDMQTGLRWLVGRLVDVKSLLSSQLELIVDFFREGIGPAGEKLYLYARTVLIQVEPYAIYTEAVVLEVYRDYVRPTLEQIALALEQHFQFLQPRNSLEQPRNSLEQPQNSLKSKKTEGRNKGNNGFDNPAWRNSHSAQAENIRNRKQKSNDHVNSDNERQKPH